MTTTPPAGDLATFGLRRLTREDFDQVVALDEGVTGHPRRGYFEKRLQAALGHPERHLQLAAGEVGALTAFAMARFVHGEYGRPEPAAVLETIAVAPGTQGLGVGRQLVDGLAVACRRRGVAELMTQARWTDLAMLGFFAGAGFALAPRQILTCPTAQLEAFERREVEHIEQDDDPAASEAEAHQVVTRTLAVDDVPAMERIDRRIVGRSRRDYLERLVDEAGAMSAIRVSQIAELDGQIIGFVMARVDFGDFGQTEPVANLDTIAVDPEFGGRGVGLTLVTQLLTQLRALRVDRLRTEVERENFRLLGFLYRCGFAPSQHLALSKTLS